MTVHPAVLRKMDLEAGRAMVRTIPVAALVPAKMLVDQAVHIVGRHAVQFPGRERLNRGLQQRGLHSPGQSDPWKRTMAVFKDSGVVVTTPSSGTYVIECIGNVGVLADLLADRVRELGGDDAARKADEAFGGGVPSAAATSSRPSRGSKASAGSSRGASKPKREPSKTKAAIAAAKRRARIKAEKLAAEQETRRNSREASLRASREPRAENYGPREEDESLDVEEDVAEAAEAMRGMIPAASPSGLGLPPDLDAVSESDGEGREEGEDGTEKRLETLETLETPVEFTERTAKEQRDRSAASLFAARLRERFPRGAAFAFDRKEAAVCDMRGWDRVAACRVRSVSRDGVHVACRTAETDGKFVGAFRVPPRAALRVLLHRAPETLGEKRLPEPPPTFPSGSAERRRAVASAATAAAALAAARREGPDALAPGSWVLERRAAAEAAAASGSGRKRPRWADATEAPPERAAGLASARDPWDIALLAHEVASFRRETHTGLASACAGLERVAAEIRALRNGGGAKPPDEDARRGGRDADARAREKEEKEATAKVADEAGPSKSPFERSAFVAEARALAALGEERASAKPSEPPRGGATAASEGADKKIRGEASPATTSRLPGRRGASASPDLSVSLEVVPETPADKTAGGALDSSAGGERFRAPREEKAGGEDESARAATSGGAALERDVPGTAFAG